MNSLELWVLGVAIGSAVVAFLAWLATRRPIGNRSRVRRAIVTQAQSATTALAIVAIVVLIILLLVRARG